LKNKILLLSLLLISIILLSGCTSNKNKDESDKGPDISNWLESYVPVHDIGNGSDDFWIDFPTSSDYYGNSIEHFDWIIGTLDDNCVLFVVHRTGCVGCKEQGDLVISLAEKYNTNQKQG